MISIFLGIDVYRSADELTLSQQQYAVDLVQCASMSECHPTATFVDTKDKLSTAEGLQVSDPIEYRSLAGAL